MKCDNVSRSCEWEGTVETVEGHVATCGFTLVPCPNECEEWNIMRKDLNSHLESDCLKRKIKCELCGEEDTYINITQFHDDLCKEKSLTCPSTGCPKIVKRGNLKEHIEKYCDYAEVSCKYENIGCNERMKRKDMREHEQNDKVHLHQALGVVVELRKDVEALKKRDVQALRKGEAFVFKLTNYEDKKNNNTKFHSSPFYTSPGGYNMTIEVEFSGSDISLYACILEGRYDHEIIWPFKGAVTFKILNQLRDQDHYIIKVEMCKVYPEDSGWGHGDLISHQKLSHDWARNVQYLKDDTLYIEVSVAVSGHMPWLECTEK